MSKLRNISGASFLVAVLGFGGLSVATEIVHLKNGDLLHGSVVSVDSKQVTLQTPYGRLKIPKGDIRRIDYDEAAEGKAPREKPEAERLRPNATKRPSGMRSSAGRGRGVISLDIRGRSFWYAFESPPDNPADLSIRLRLFLGEKEAAMLLDTKPDTFDKHTYYNSFTFSRTDSRVVRTGTGFDCSVLEAGDGRVLLKLQVPEGQKEGEYLLRMLYQVNEGSREFPRWIDAVSRPFPLRLERGKESYIILEQDASRLEYSGLFRKRMKNLESFQVSVLSSELRDPSTEPEPEPEF